MYVISIFSFKNKFQKQISKTGNNDLEQIYVDSDDINHVEQTRPIQT